MLEVVLSLLAAAAYAVGSVLQRRGAISAPSGEGFRLGLVVDLLRQPVWLVGIAAMIVGVVFQAFALHGGAIALVEPILVIELPFTLLLAALVFRAPVDRRTGASILVTTPALSLLLFLARPAGGDVRDVPDFAWAMSLVAAGGLMVVLSAASLRAPPDGRAALLGIASGVGHGLAATLIKATTVVGADGLTPVITSWKPYAAIVAGGASLYLFQVGLQAGSLVAPQAGLNILDPLVSTAFGLVLFGERARAGLLLIPEMACVVVLTTAIFFLARSPLLHVDEQGDPRPARPRHEPVPP